MKKIALFALFLAPASALAQTLPQDPALQRAEAEAQVNQTLLQTQQSNLSAQYSVQQNELRLQQQLDAMPPPAYQLPAYQLPAYQPGPASAPPRQLNPKN